MRNLLKITYTQGPLLTSGIRTTGHHCILLHASTITMSLSCCCCIRLTLTRKITTVTRNLYACCASTVYTLRRDTSMIFPHTDNSTFPTCVSDHFLSSACRLMSTDARADPCNAHDENTGWTPLHNCSRNGRSQCCKNLLAAKADLTLVNKMGETAMHIASRKGKVTVLQILLDCAVEREAIAALMTQRDKCGCSLVDLAAVHAEHRRTVFSR